MRYDLVVFVEFISQLVFLLPRFRFFDALKKFYLRLFFGAKIGRGVVFYSGVWIFPGRFLSVGDDVDFAKDVLVTTGGGVSIGDRVLIGYRTQIISANHIVPPLPDKIFGAGHEKKSVTIEDDVWIGASCIILPGVRVGRGSIVAAGSVVTKDVPPFVYVAGVPAKIVKSRS